MAYAAFVVAAIMAGASPAPPAAWEKVFESTGPKEWTFAVLAFGRDDWFAGGVWGVARGTASGVERKATSPRAVMGLAGDSHEDVFALGDGELVLHFDGKAWTEEHVGPRATRPRQVDDILQSLLEVEGTSVAFGPALVLIRQRRAWSPPPAPERRRLHALASAGPPLGLPAKCAQAGWFWLGKATGFFDCHDGRAFLLREGTIIPKGMIPRECGTGFHDLTTGQGEVFASCGDGNVWRTEGTVWRRYATFRGQRVGSISATEKCVFVAGSRAVWRNCKP